MMGRKKWQQQPLEPETAAAAAPEGEDAGMSFTAGLASLDGESLQLPDDYADDVSSLRSSILGGSLRAISESGFRKEPQVPGVPGVKPAGGVANGQGNDDGDNLLDDDEESVYEWFFVSWWSEASQLVRFLVLAGLVLLVVTIVLVVVAVTVDDDDGDGGGTPKTFSGITFAPAAAAFSLPSMVPSSLPSAVPTASPVPTVSPVPTAMPIPTSVPTPVPTLVPTLVPSPAPTLVPTLSPEPTRTSPPDLRNPSPSERPSPSPSERPTPSPSPAPSKAPTGPPSPAPSPFPTATPTRTLAPTTNTLLQTFYVMGGQFTGQNLNSLPERLGSLDTQRDTAFLVHLGGWSDPPDCTSAAYQAFAELYANSEIPVYTILGANETNTCSDPEEALDLYGQYALNYNVEHWRSPRGYPVLRQEGEYPNNFAFSVRGLLYVGLHMVGDPEEDEREWNDRIDTNLDFLDDSFDTYRGSTAATVVFFQAGPDDPSVQSFYTQIENRIQNRYNRATVVVHLTATPDEEWGLTERYNGVDNFVLATVERGTWPPMRVIVNTASDSRSFAFDQGPWSRT